jgi:hypothetical protein
MVIEAQSEKMRVSEMTAARDAAVQRLSKAYESIRQKSAIIERLQQESTIKYPFPLQAAEPEILEISEIPGLKEEITRLEAVIRALRDQLTTSKDIVPTNFKSSDSPPQYDETNLKVSFHSFKILHSSRLESSRAIESRTTLSSFRCHDTAIWVQNGFLDLFYLVSIVSLLPLSELIRFFSLAHP